MTFIENYGFLILILAIAVIYILILEMSKKSIKESIQESFSNKSKYDSQFVPVNYFDSCNLKKDRKNLKERKLDFELPFNANNAGYIDLGLPPRVKLNSYPTLNFHSPNGPKSEDYYCC
tara:strand:- start:135 stop:491 length:357 start_codon:yes stop_codon:yes gene_type:complete